MTNFDYLHEVEEVILHSDTKQPCTNLWRLLKQQGFTQHDDVFSLDRPKNTLMPMWQTRTIVAVHIYDDSEEVYDTDDEWNQLVFKYMLATQPREGIAAFVSHVAALSERLNIPMKFRGNLVTRGELEGQLARFADDLTSQVDAPGSESVAIVIESTYPRR
ncbi:MAG: hypothetical protein U0746_17840 [Gemmataceae bacterium]